jgi:para-aminobenzoate synthetase component 1
MRLELPDLGRLRAKRVDLPPPDSSLLARLQGLHRVTLLDSSAGGRFTLVAASPLARLTWTPAGGEVSLPGGVRARQPDFTPLLREALQLTAAPGDAPLPVGPGWIGLLGYGLRVAFESVPERCDDPTGIADADLAYYPAVAVFDHRDSAWWFLFREHCADHVRPLHACLRRAAARPEFSVGAMEPRIERSQYLAAVARAVEYVHAGDVFQVNYAHEFRAPFAGSPLGLYLALRDSNPAPFCAYLDLGGDTAVLSTSPELFLRVRGDSVVTRPIKGTRPRGADAGADAALRAELERSEKDAAELAMIVDLSRNDLGRVCTPGSVEVTRGSFIESYASVHHRVAEVVGELERGCDRAELLAASFPGGSITGAPKIRAMEIIDELETARRGPYTGSIGILADDGSMDLNIAIRTPVVARGLLRLHVGGGVVADSVPDDEHAETLAKGRAILEALH